MKHKIPILITLIVLLAGILIGTFILKKNQLIGEATVPEGCNGAAICNGKSASVGGMGISYKTGEITISKEGTYSLSGNFEGYVFVKAEASANVTLILNGFEVESDSTPAIYAKGCAKLSIESSEGTENKLVDGRSTAEVEEATISSSVVYCKNDIEVRGGGKLRIEGNGDTLHSKGNISIEGGETILSSGDDGVHAEKTLAVNAGSISVENSEEGLEGKQIEINGGSVFVNANDDGFNATDGTETDLSGESASEVYIKITGGDTHVIAGGDGLDSNGGIYISGGYTYVEGPVSDGDGIIDYSTEAVITGGTFIGVGSSGMLESFAESSTQNVIVNCLSETAAPGELQIVDSSGNALDKVTISKTVAAYIYSSDKVTKSESIGNTRGGMPGGMRGGDMPGGMPGGDMPEGMPSGEAPGDFDPGQQGGM